MEIFWAIMLVASAVLLLTLLISLVCFYVTFYVPRRKTGENNELSLPPGGVYEPYKDTMFGWIKQAREIKHSSFSITSFDGLKLCAKYYEYAPGAPIELMLHGYRGSAERDLCGGVQRCFSLGRSAFIVDQRACGNSEGRVITFGVNESRDCLSWVDFLINHFGNDVKIILTGISMGASTVMIAGSTELPENVIGIIADCGYTSAPDIIKKVIHQMKLPATLLYPFVRLGAKIYGRFDPEDAAPVKVLKNCRIPIFIAHGEADDFVPCDMGIENYNACKCPKKLLTVPGAGHGLSYLVAPETYINALLEIRQGNIDENMN